MPPPPTRPQPKETRRDGIVKWGTLVIALAGLLTGLFNLVESRLTRIELHASQGTSSFQSFQVSLVNNSSHAVSIVRGQVLFDGMKIGSVTRLVPISGGGDLQARLDAQDRASDLPFSLAAGQAFAGRADWVTPEEGFSPDALKSFDRYMERPRRGGQPSDGRLVLELDPEPGKAQAAPVRLTTGEARSDQDPGGLDAGQSLIDLTTSGHVRDLYFASVVLAPTVVTLTLWGIRPHAALTRTRPMLDWAGTGEQRATFAIPRALSDGTYSWEMSTGGRTLAVGAFRTPCLLSPGPGGPTLKALLSKGPAGPALRAGSPRALTAGSCSPRAAQAVPPATRSGP